MKVPSGTSRAADDRACEQKTGRWRAHWIDAIDKWGAQGRAAVGKYLLSEKVNPWWIATLTVDHEAAKGIVEKDGQPKGYSICSTKSPAVSAERVFEALTSPEDLAHWFGPGAVCRTSTTCQPTRAWPGGKRHRCSARAGHPGPSRR